MTPRMLWDRMSRSGERGIVGGVRMPVLLRAQAVGARRSLIAYALGLVASAAMLLAVTAGGSQVAVKTPVVLFLIPIILSAYAGGLGPGLLCTAIDVLGCVYFVLRPTHTWHVDGRADTLRWVTLTVAGVLISVLSEGLHRSRRRAESDDARLAGIIDSAMDAIITTDERHRIVIFNPAAEKMFGWKAADVLGQPHEVLIPERFRATHAENLRAFAEANITHRGMGNLGTVYGLRANGEEFPIEASISQVGPAGQKLLTVIMRDISERRYGEENRSLLAAIVESSEDAIVGRDLEGTIVSWNPGAQKLYGYSPEEAIGRKGSMLVPQEIRDEADTPVRIKRGQSVHHYETVRLGKNGQRIDVAVTVSPIRDRNGCTTGTSTISRDITARKSAEALLQLRTKALEAAANGILITDRDGAIVWVNEAVTRLTGYLPEELLGRNPRTLKSGKQDLAFYKDLWERISAGKVWQGEIVNRRKDASLYTEEQTITPVRDSAGSVTHFIAIKQDVTERKRAQEALLQSERRLAMLARASSTGLWEWDLHTNTVYYSPEWKSQIGYAEDEISNGFEEWEKRVHADDVARSLARVRAFLANPEGEFQNEFRFRHKDGSCRWILARASVARDEQGDPCRMMGSHVDITELKRAEEEIKKLNEGLERRVAERTAALEAANRQLEREISERKRAQEALAKFQRRTDLILNSAGDGILGLDVEGRCIFSNPAAQRMLGYTNDELVGQDVHVLARHRLPDGTPCRAEDCGVSVTLKQRVIHQAQGQIIHRKDGTAFPVDQVTTPIVEHGEIVGAVLIFRDVSERRAVEEMKDRFVSMVSHELRTPLTAIRGSLGLLAAKSPALSESSRTRRMLEMAVANTDRLTRLVNDILDLERLEAGGVPLVRTGCDASELMLQAADLMRGMAETQGVSLEVEALSLPLFVNQDGILQLLTNLLSNAIKFSPPQSTVRLTVERDPDVAIFKVSDEGPGIPPDKLESIFGRFQPVDASDTRRRGGTGLGLSICRSIVRRHGGKIWVESELGRGSTFIFTLSLAGHERGGTVAGESVLLTKDPR